MKRLLDWSNIEMIKTDIDKLRRDHPKATVVFNTEEMCIQVLYPLPPSFYKINDLTTTPLEAPESGEKIYENKSN